jgi:hypothetical protein
LPFLPTPIGRVAAASDRDSNSDWALIDLHGDVFTPPNLYFQSSSMTPVYINSIFPGTASTMTEVTVLLAPTNTVKGIIGQSNIKLNIDGWSITATQIVIDDPLRMLISSFDADLTY